MTTDADRPALSLTPMDLAERRELNQGFGDALARAVELIGTPALLALSGWLLDRWLGTVPLFLLIGLGIGVIGVGLAEWYTYDARMRTHEEDYRTRRSGGLAAPARIGPTPLPEDGLPTGISLDAPVESAAGVDA